MPVKDPIQMKAGGGGSGNIDGFDAKFNKSGGLVWSTYYGGDKNDNPTDIEQDQHGNLYFCGLTQGDYPIKNAYQNSFGGGSDGFITKILDCTGLYSKVKILAKNFCFGDTVILSADGGYNTYRWSNGDSTQSIKVTKSGVYSAIISSSGGCSGSTQAITLKFTNPPASSIQPSGPLTFCKGDSVGLAATGVYPKYLWSNGDTTYKIIAKNAGKYVLTTYNASGCSVSDSVNVSYLKSPSPLITGSNNFSLCPAGSVVLDAGKGYKKYVWNTGDTTEKITVTKIDSFQVTVDSATLTCKGISPWVHTRNVNINIVSNNSATTCGDSVVLDAGYGFSSYLWNTGETTQIITVGKSGNYKVIVKTSSGCTDTSKPFKVIIYPAPVKPEIVQNGDTLSTKQGQKYGYQWSENGQPIAGETKYKLTPIGEGTYSVETTDSNGCQISSDPYVIGSGYFKVFPNPTTSILFVESETSGPVDYKYEMFDMLGRELINDDDGLHSGIYKKQISLETFAGAMYILRVKVGTVVYTNKIVKSQRY